MATGCASSPASSATRARNELRLAHRAARRCCSCRSRGAGYVWFQRRRVREAARFVQPALLPNVVDRVPGWRRHLPVAILLLAVASFLLGFARPHATLSERSEEATVVLAIDTSHSMAATDVAPTRLAAAQASARRFLAELPKKYRVAVVAFSSRAQLVARADAETASSSTRRSPRSASARATALGDAMATAVKVAGDAAAASSAPAGERRRRPSILVLSDGAQDGGRVRLADAIRQARTGEGARLHRPARHARPESCRCRTSAALSSGSRCRRPGGAAHGRRRRRAASFFAAPTQDDLEPVYADLKSRLGNDAQGRGDHRRLRRGRRPAPARRRRALGALVQEGSVIRARAGRRSPLTAALALNVAAGAAAADECSGLQVCIPVAGPWVVIPPPGGAVRDGDLAARVPAGHRRRSRCAGQRGSGRRRVPRAARQPRQPRASRRPARSLFKGTYAGRARRATSYRPYIGCIPGGGGGPRTPMAFSRASAVKPGQPITMRVDRRSASTPGTLARTTLACRRGERLLRQRRTASGSTRRCARRAAQLAAVRVVRVRRGGHVLVSATRRGLAADVRAVVQVQAECAR